MRNIGVINRQKRNRVWAILSAAVLCFAVSFLFFPYKSHAVESSLNILFIGNSYTARHQLPDLIKQMAEQGIQGLKIRVTSVTYAGRRLKNHWELGTQNFVRLWEITDIEQQSRIELLESKARLYPKDKYFKKALVKHRQLLSLLRNGRKKWDVVILQTFRDEATTFPQYAAKFASLAKAQSAKVILYETTPKTLNSKPLDNIPDEKIGIAKAKLLAHMAKELEASVVPMSLIAMRAVQKIPNITLRFKNDPHLNQNMAYLTASAFFAVLFDLSPEGLTINKVRDIRFYKNSLKTLDKDGNPIVKVFSPQETSSLQRTAWDGIQEFKLLQQKINETVKEY